jgi:hypothetical protein
MNARRVLSGVVTKDSYYGLHVYSPLPYVVLIRMLRTGGAGYFRRA